MAKIFARHPSKTHVISPYLYQKLITFWSNNFALNCRWLKSLDANKWPAIFRPNNSSTLQSNDRCCPKGRRVDGFACPKATFYTQRESAYTTRRIRLINIVRASYANSDGSMIFIFHILIDIVDSRRLFEDACVMRKPQSHLIFISGTVCLSVEFYYDGVHRFRNVC